MKEVRVERGVTQTPCLACEGRGKITIIDPNDSSVKEIGCDECEGKGVITHTHSIDRTE